MPTQRIRPARFLVPLAMATLLGVTACSGGGEGATDDDVATLGSGDDDPSDAGADDEGGGGQGGRQLDPEFQDAMIEFAECMREQGIDFPDPQIEDGGGVVIAGPAGGADGGPPSESELAEMEAANEECQPILDAVEGAMPELDPEQEQEMQDNALAFAECMREHGIDMPDPVFGENGRISQSIGGPDSPIDFEDEDFQEAQEACRPEGEEGGPGIVVGGVPAGGSTGGAGEDEG